MDLAVAWYQKEQEGRAQRTWEKIWETISEMDQTMAVNNLNNNNLENNKSNKDFILLETTNNGTNERTYYNPSRRKGSTLDNRASTYNMNKYHARLVGKHGGCPWRPMQYKYGRGVIG